MKEIFSKMISKGNKQCKLTVYVDSDSCCLNFTALGRTNPPGGGKRERFIIFDESYEFDSINDIDTEILPLIPKNEKFKPLAECFTSLHREFLESQKNA
ncbi:hypothetical protein CJP72_25030 [Citrobacter sp. NCU1]|uniref:hypothetical protein n=1 Tax=Citrobacter sp. NCU1 TaxID=2026683 RepID=UPI0013911912|nr:hypothetical protein [Citrobacter sp. NCU1]NDO83882.1 hypothetical protein [Citrobacter sp. NCU1]